MYRLLFAVFTLFALGVASSGTDTASAVFTPTVTINVDETFPDDPNIIPSGTSCDVSAPCKVHYQISIPAGQPGTTTYPGVTAGTKSSSNFVGFVTDAGIPDGAIVGSSFGSVRIGPPGFCSFGPILPYSGVNYKATINPATTTGNVSDLSSFSNWPSQLDTVKNNFISAHPGATLAVRTLGIGTPYPGNTLTFLLADGSRESVIVQGNPNLPVDYVNCGPTSAEGVFLGVTKDNPSTPSTDEGGVPLLSCKAPGPQTFDIPLDPNDTPPGDPTVASFIVNCVDNTPTGSPVVNLLGGLSTIGGVRVTFTDVLTAGSTSVTSSTMGPPPPFGFALTKNFGGEPTYYDFDTTAYTGSPLEVCISYPDPPGGDDSQLESGYRLMRNFDGQWYDTTTFVDVADNVVCGETFTFSTWAIMSTKSVGGVIEVVSNGDGGSAPYQTAVAAAVALALLGASGVVLGKRRSARGR
jgi:hypothetical protein